MSDPIHDAADGDPPVGRVARLRELENLDATSCAELTTARRLGFTFEGASPPGTPWERLHAWERSTYLHGSRELDRLARLELVADLAEHLTPILATEIGVSLVEMVGPAFGLTVNRPDPERAPAEHVTPSTLDLVRQGDEAAVSSLEARAAALAGKIKAKGGSVPSAVGDEGPPPTAPQRLGMTVRKV